MRFLLRCLIVVDDDHPVLFVEGEEIVGAKQNRLVSRSVLVEARTGTAVPVVCRGVFAMFFVMSNELNTPKVLSCPTENADTAHTRSTTWPDGVTGGYTNDSNVSYFIAVDADENGLALTASSRQFLAGDRFMGPGSVALPPGTNIFNTAATYCQALGVNPANVIFNWATDVGHGSVGNIGMTDGSVTGFSPAALRTAVLNSGDVATAHTQVGNMNAGANRLQFPSM